MEITYRLTEAEYAKAWKVRSKRRNGSGLPKTILFWLFVLICLTLLCAVIQKKSSNAGGGGDDSHLASADGQAESNVSINRSLILNTGPFILLAAVWLILAFRLGPMRLRRLYRKDPLMQGLFTVDVTADTIAVQNTAGLSSQFGWNLFEYWCEGNGLIVLVYFSSAYFTLSLANLSEQQCADLRGILAAALPQK